MSDHLKEALLNSATGAAPYKPPPPLLALAQSLLEGVQSGRITSLAAIIVTPMGHIQWPGFGMQTLELMTGAELMRDDMKAAMRGQGNKILRAG
jgi:hypothetical protein